MLNDDADDEDDGNNMAGSRTAPAVKGGEPKAQGGLDLSAAVHVGRGPANTAGNSAGKGGVSDPMEVVEEANAPAAALAAPAAAVVASAASAAATTGCAKGVAQSRSTLLLQPTEAIQGVLDSIAEAMRSAVAHPDEGGGRKSRPLFDSPTALLKLCEVSPSWFLQADVMAVRHTRLSWGMLLKTYFLEVR